MSGTALVCEQKSRAPTGWPTPGGCPFWTLEAVNDVELKPVQVLVRLAGDASARGRGCSVLKDGVLERGVQGAATPECESGGRVRVQPVQGVEAVLQDVRGSALIAFYEGGDRRILLLPQIGVADLEVSFV